MLRHRAGWLREKKSRVLGGQAQHPGEFRHDVMTKQSTQRLLHHRLRESPERPGRTIDFCKSTVRDRTDCTKATAATRADDRSGFKRF